VILHLHPLFDFNAAQGRCAIKNNLPEVAYLSCGFAWLVRMQAQSPAVLVGVDASISPCTRNSAEFAIFYSILIFSHISYCDRETA